MILNMTVNGREVRVDVPESKRLLDILRDDLLLTGTKEGCGVGECGACTVIVDDAAVNACLVLSAQLTGSRVETVEGLDRGGHLSPLQQAFLEHGAVQCGFCTPGMLMSAIALLRKNPRPTEAEIRTALAGNLCRCTGYAPITEAILAVVAAGDHV
jgi:aerobic carbon-monoxide dehydrogenase small subunit